MNHDATVLVLSDVMKYLQTDATATNAANADLAANLCHACSVLPACLLTTISQRCSDIGCRWRLMCGRQLTRIGQREDARAGQRISL